jgi:poly-beta-1,6-N-acetyl-D-glucosamine synthase
MTPPPITQSKGSQLAPGWIGCATDALARDCEVGGVSGTYTGEDGPGLLRQLQRNEFVRASRLVRRRADLWVLSGTGTMFRVPALRHVARERGRRLPGVPGECYDSTSITEDYEITLALKTLGYRCLCPPGCTARTELMPTWQHLFRQRLRWQSGTLTALRRYGFTSSAHDHHRKGCRGVRSPASRPADRASACGRSLPRFAHAAPRPSGSVRR